MESIPCGSDDKHTKKRIRLVGWLPWDSCLACYWLRLYLGMPMTSEFSTNLRLNNVWSEILQLTDTSLARVCSLDGSVVHSLSLPVCLAYALDVAESHMRMDPEVMFTGHRNPLEHGRNMFKMGSP
uniref:Claudin-1 n=1 Tax=Phallusia mammillata TaxID=59560 RepID=A0A6F9DA38_9ASCI|nr:claudin-1 [Phallusia mammillata]